MLLEGAAARSGQRRQGHPFMEKRAPNDADDAGQVGRHHQHHEGLVSPIWSLPVPQMGPGG